MSHSNSLVLIYSVACASALVLYNKAFYKHYKIDFILSWITTYTYFIYPVVMPKKLLV